MGEWEEWVGGWAEWEGDLEGGELKRLLVQGRQLRVAALVGVLLQSGLPRTTAALLALALCGRD